MTTWWVSGGRKCDSGSLTGSVSAFGAVAPRSIPSSKPVPDTAMATLGSDSLLHESLRITVLMTRSMGPVGPCPSTGPYVPRRPPGCADTGEPDGGVDTCVTWAVPPGGDLRSHYRRRCHR